ncbi:MAG: hypothetical protein ACU0CI_08280, partial [Shimia sp.]
SREAGLGFASGLQASDQMALQRFTVAISASEQWPVDILLPGLVKLMFSSHGWGGFSPLLNNPRVCAGVDKTQRT